jgi:hypothetical protein
MSQIYQQNIYLVVQGTSCNQIIDFIQEHSNVEIEKEKYPKLDELGIREMFVCRDIPDNQSLLGIQDVSKIYPKILTTLDVPAIESAFILYYQIADAVEVIPVPYLSNQSNVRNTRNLDKLKEIFQGGNPKKYWDKRDFSSNLTANRFGINSLKSKVPALSWNYTKNRVSYTVQNNRGQPLEYNVSGGLSNYQFSSFLEKILYPMVRENVQNSQFVGEIQLSNNSRGMELKPIVLVCNDKTVVSFLEKVRSKGYRREKDLIERGSIWKIEMKYEPKMNGNRMTHDFQFIQHEKKFPTAFHYNKSANQYMIKYKGKSIPLSLATELLQKKTALSLECKFCKNEGMMKEALQKIYSNMQEENKNKNKNKNKNQNESNKNVKINNKPKLNVNSFESAMKALTQF